MILPKRKHLRNLKDFVNVASLRPQKHLRNLKDFVNVAPPRPQNIYEIFKIS
jgi:hypothetical protein